MITIVWLDGTKEAVNGRLQIRDTHFVITLNGRIYRYIPFTAVRYIEEGP